MQTLTHEIAAVAARLVVEDGLDYGSAKRRAGKQLGVPPRTALPGNDELESAVREHIAVFHGDTQPSELAALRRLALVWMERLAEFRPHRCGAVWSGTATRLSDIHLQLFCDDPKSAEFMLIDQHIDYEAHTANGFNGAQVTALSFSSRCPELGETVGVHLMIHDHDELRGALRPGANGRAARGDRAALQRRLEAGA